MFFHRVHIEKPRDFAILACAVKIGQSERMVSTRTLAISMLDEALRLHRPPETMHLPGSLADSDVRFVRAMVLNTLRHVGQIDVLLARQMEKPLAPSKHWLLCALRLGVAQLICMQIAPHAAIGETVQAVRESKHKALAGLVNAVLHNIAPESALPAVETNLPQWLWARWGEWYGKPRTAQYCALASVQPPIDILYRDGTQKRVSADTEVTKLDGYDAGSWMVQDAAASQCVQLLPEDLRGKTVLEIGAAPGGKTAQLCWRGAEVTALDRSAKRMERLQENMQRLQLNPTCVVADALEYTPDKQFDIVVLDAPCSATGTWRRHPEVVHLLTPPQLDELVGLQKNILARAWQWVKPGGQLLYMVCSLEQEEGEAQIAQFLQEYKNASPQGAALRTHPADRAEDGGMDGFYAALLLCGL